MFIVNYLLRKEYDAYIWNSSRLTDGNRIVVSYHWSDSHRNPFMVSFYEDDLLPFLRIIFHPFSDLPSRQFSPEIGDGGTAVLRKDYSFQGCNLVCQSICCVIWHCVSSRSLVIPPVYSSQMLSNTTSSVHCRQYLTLPIVFISHFFDFF
jgi:hypothetical protein